MSFPRSVILLTALLLASCGHPGSSETHLEFDGGRAMALVERQVSFGPRVPGSPGHRKAAEFFVREFASHADTVRTDRWQHVTVAGDTLPLVNIIAAFNTRASHRVLLCAHWDTRPTAEHDPDPDRRDEPIPGANDGGSGVAVLLELARVLDAHPPVVGVDIVLFDGEDYGDFHRDEDVLLGSRRFADRHANYRPALGILLDMVGDREARFPYEGHSHQWLREDVELVWNTADELGYGRFFVDQAGPAVIDDHVPLLRKGIRCIDIVQMGLPYWHTHEDTPDKVSPVTLEAVGRTVAAVIYRLDTSG